VKIFDQASHRHYARSVKPFAISLLLLAVLSSASLLLGASNVDELRTKADAGDAAAQFNLGVMYANGEGVPKDSVEAVKWYLKAAEQGVSEAQCSLGMMYDTGEGVPRDSAEALRWYRKAADQGHAGAQFNLGLMYAKDKGVAIDLAEAAKWFRKAADQDYVAAQSWLGNMYAIGAGVAKDPAEAVKWYLKAAEQGVSEAQCKLGVMYNTGDGVPKDSAEALKWFRKAADQGDAEAQFNLGMIYFNRFVGAQNLAEATKWFRKAADQGYAAAQTWLGIMYDLDALEGMPKDRAETIKEFREGMPKDSAEAVRLFRKAADQGYADAQFALGGAYAEGNGVPKNSAAAVSWYRKAAEQGHANAQYWLANMYDDGEGVPKDSAEALRWYRKAAAQGNGFARFKVAEMDAFVGGCLKAAEEGNADSQCTLGTMYAIGYGVPKNSAVAAMWYRKAADQGDALAQFNLGAMYATGEGVPKDSAEAAKWYRKAAEQGVADAQNNLGVMYLEGVGVLKDEIEALAWYNVSAASGNEVAVQNRASFERRLGREATLAAQQRAKEILDEIEAAKARQTAFKSSPSATGAVTTTPKSSGSGAIVSAQGHVLTAAHVVADAATLRVVTAQGTWPATVLRIDESNDVAILKISGGSYVPLPVAPSRWVRLGQTVATIGFPNVGIQGFSPKVTRGEISSLNGIADDPRSWQISVPVQPGNSGGPLLDEHGNLIGIVVSKLGLKAAQATGDIPQNVNYAVKSAYALALLEPYLDKNAPEPRQGTKSFEDMVAQAQQSVVLILAY
jgi:TPR repeat protein